MSNANEMGLSYVAELTWGECPATPAFQCLRFTSESLKQDTSTVVSKEIRSDRQTAGLFRTNINASGDIAFELSYGSFDAFLCAALFAEEWVSAIDKTFAADVVIEEDDQTLTVADVHFSETFEVGQWLKLSGFVETENNGYFKIIEIDDDNHCITLRGLTTNLVDETVSGGTGVHAYCGTYIWNGVTQTSFTLEKNFTDISRYAYYYGMVIDSLSLNISPEEIITGTFGFMGYKEVSVVAPPAGATTTVVTSNEVVNAVDHVAVVSFWDDEGTPITGLSLLNLSIELKNNVRSRLKIAHLGPFSMGAGKCEVSGKVQAYFESAALITPYLAAEELGFALLVTDVTRASYLIELPSIKFSGGQRVCGGENTDIVEDMEFTAYRDEVDGTTIKIQKFPA